MEDKIKCYMYNDTHLEGQGFEWITYVTGQFVMTVLIVLLY